MRVERRAGVEFFWKVKKKNLSVKERWADGRTEGRDGREENLVGVHVS